MCRRRNGPTERCSTKLRSPERGSPAHLRLNLRLQTEDARWPLTFEPFVRGTPESAARETGGGHPLFFSKLFHPGPASSPGLALAAFPPGGFAPPTHPRPPPPQRTPSHH